MLRIQISLTLKFIISPKHKFKSFWVHCLQSILNILYIYSNIVILIDFLQIYFLKEVISLLFFIIIWSYKDYYNMKDKVKNIKKSINSTISFFMKIFVQNSVDNPSSEKSKTKNSISNPIILFWFYLLRRIWR